MQLHFYKITLIHVVDGDTVDFWIDLGFDIRTKRRIRLTGINTPESRGRTAVLGYDAKRHLRELMAGHELRLHSEKLIRGQPTGEANIEKFGRVLGTIYRITSDGEFENLNQRMIADGHALPYDGGKRSDADFLTDEFINNRVTPADAA